MISILKAKRLLFCEMSGMSACFNNYILYSYRIVTMSNDDQSKNYLNDNSYLLSVDTPAPTSWNMGQGVLGSYAGLKLKPNCQSSWRKCPSENPTYPVGTKLFVPQGTPLPLKNEMVYQAPPKNSMFYWAYNHSSPACCPATFSSDTGCICTNKKQRDFIGMYRGGNHSLPGDPEF